MILLVLAWEEREPRIQFCQNAAKAPHVDCLRIRNPKNDFGRPVKPRLYVGVNALIEHAARPIVNYLDSRLVRLLEQNVLRLHIAVDDIVFALKLQGLQDLDREPPHQGELNTLKIVDLDELIQVDREQLKGYD